MNADDRLALVPRAEQVYRSLDDGDYASVAQQMTFFTRRALTDAKVMDVWSQVTTTAGALQSLGSSFVRPSGSHVVVETPLLFESDVFVGRMAYNRSGKVVGMLIMHPHDIVAAPF